MAYTDYQVFIDISASDGTIAGNDDWMYRFCKEQMQDRGGWDRQVVGPYIEYTTTQGMAPFNPLAAEQWLVRENDGNAMDPILVCDDLRGYPSTLNVPPLFLKAIIETGAGDIASSHDGVMEAIALMQPGWEQGPTTINGSGHYVTRWDTNWTTDAVSNGANPDIVPYTVLSGLLKRLFTEHGNLINGGYIITNQPRVVSVIGEHSNPGRISLFLFQDPNLHRVEMFASVLSAFNSGAILHPADVDYTSASRVATRGILFDPGQTTGFANPHQLVCRMGGLEIAAGCPKLVDIRRSASDPIPVTTAFYAAHPRNSGSNQGEGFYVGLAVTGSTYLSFNGTVRINDQIDSNILASPHILYWNSAAPAGFTPGAPRWSSGQDDASDSRGQIVEPWFGYNPFSSTLQGAIFGQLHDCIVINDSDLVEGATLTFDGRTFKVFSQPTSGTGRPFAKLAFRVGDDDDATSPP